MRVLFASSEAVPFAKTGGLGDVAGSLPRALKHAGAKAAVILPKYSTIPQEYQDRMKHVADFYVPLAWRNDYCGIEKLTLQGLDFYFVDNEYLNKLLADGKWTSDDQVKSEQYGFMLRNTPERRERSINP